MILLDANYILRFLLKDNLEMYEISKDCILNNKCEILNEVLAEVIFVLLKVYQVDKKDITNSLKKLINHNNIIVSNKNTLTKALNIFHEKNLDFIDSILCANSSFFTIKTFDKKLNICIKSNIL